MRADKAAPPGRPAILLSEAAAGEPVQPDLLQSLPDAERIRLLASGRTRRLARGEALFRQGDSHDGIALIESGRVRSFYTAPSGREITLAYWGGGNFVGGPEMFGAGVHMWTALAVQPTAVVMLPGRALRDIALNVPQAAVAIIDALIYKAKCYSALAQMLGTRSMMQRLCQLVLHLMDTHGVQHADGVAIATSLTHAELANLIGATRQWVTISLTRLQEEGALRQRKGLMIVLRPELLGRSAALTPAGAGRRLPRRTKAQHG